VNKILVTPKRSFLLNAHSLPTFYVAALGADFHIVEEPAVSNDDLGHLFMGGKVAGFLNFATKELKTPKNNYSGEKSYDDPYAEGSLEEENAINFRNGSKLYVDVTVSGHGENTQPESVRVTGQTRLGEYRTLSAGDTVRITSGGPLTEEIMRSAVSNADVMRRQEREALAAIAPTIQVSLDELRARYFGDWSE
jgi:hypothetical protein